ncbi:Uncharacterised protein [Burkholderia pseudomallei]|nr:Uncharacterised protein [Burkholderia pseudomallei]
MNIRQHGLDAAVTAGLSRELRERHADLFRLGDQCAQVGVDLAARLAEARSKRQIIVGQFFARTLSHFQGAFLLAETGMAIESLTLSRSLVETCFVMLAIVEDAVTPEELLQHDLAMRLKHANVLRTSRNYPNVAPMRSTLDAFAEKAAGAKEIGFQEFAKRGKALAAYDGLYRHLSNNALHATLSAVEDYLVKADDVRFAVVFRPLIEKTGVAVLTACVGIIIAAKATARTGLSTPEIDAAVSEIWEAYVALDAQHNPWSRSGN